MQNDERGTMGTTGWGLRITPGSNGVMQGKRLETSKAGIHLMISPDALKLARECTCGGFPTEVSRYDKIRSRITMRHNGMVIRVVERNEHVGPVITAMRRHLNVSKRCPSCGSVMSNQSPPQTERGSS